MRLRADARRLVVALAIALVACGNASGPAVAPALVERVVGPRTPSTAPPILVLLHGFGANEEDLLSLAAQFDPRLLVVSVRAPRVQRAGFAWFQLEFPAPGEVVPNVAQAHETLADFVRWVGAAPARLGADARRLYLLGFSQGAMMSLGVLCSAPERVAGIVAFSGRFDDRFVPARAADDAIARVPVFVAHGTRDRLLPVADGRAIRDRFQAVVRDFTYREYEVGHTIAPDQVRDAAAWLTARLDR